MPYIGNQHNVGDHVNNFKVLDDISSHTATFDGSATSVVSAADDTIRIPEHRFIQGQRVTYTNGGGGNIGGLTTGTAYFVSFDTANTIKLATTLANANSNTVINLSSVGSGTSHTLNVAFDGINTKFKITHGSGKAARLNNATQLNVAINNVIQRPNINSVSFTEGFAIEDNHKIVFKTAPTVNDVFWGSIIANTIENFDLRDNEVDNFTGDGSTTEFTLSTIPANNESVVVSINGVVQHPSDKNTARSYTLIDSIIQFTAAPAIGDGIQVRHIGFAGATTADVSGFYGRTGNVALTSSDHITTGDITSRNINSSGIITATTFDGAFSSSVGGSNANFTGIITAGVFKTGDFDGRNLNISGIATFAGDVSIGGTLTYEDVTNIDSVGIITARDGIHVGAGVSAVGVGTFSGLDISGDIDVDGHTNLDNGNVAGIVTFNSGAALHTDGGQILLKDRPNGNSNNLFFGTGGKAVIFHDGTNFSQVNNTGHFFLGQGVGNKDLMLYAQASGNVLLQQNTGVRYVKGVGSDASVQLFFNNNLRLNTTTAGVSIPKDLDVDGHTNLDNVSVAGISTFSGIVDAVNTPASIRVAQDIQHKGDANTKISFPANDEISFDTSGHDRIYIKSDGKIGMGTVTPAVDIHHFSDGLNGNGVRLENREGYVSFTNDANGLYFDAEYFNFRNRAGSTSYASINTSGNLSVFYDLDVDGHTNLDNVNVGGATTTTGVVVINAGTQSTNTTTGALRVAGGVGVVKNVNVGGDLDVDGHTELDNVNISGVSTYAGQARFNGELVGSIISVQNSINISDKLIHSGDPDTCVRFPSNDTIQFETAGSDRLSINSTGKSVFRQNNGSTNNTYQIVAELNARTTGSAAADFGPALYLSHTFAGANYAGSLITSQTDADVNTTHISFYPRNYGWTEALRITKDGIIETGTAAGASGADGNQRLRVGRAGDCNIAVRATASTTAATGLDFGDSGDDRAGRIQYMHDGDYMSFHTNGAGSGTDNERIRIKSNGYVGVNETNPQYPLHVAGATTVSAPTGTGILMGLQHEHALIHLNAADDKGAIIDFSVPGQDRRGGILYYFNNNPTASNRDSMQFYTAGQNERLRMTSDGRISINDSSPTSQETLTIRPSGNIACDVALKMNSSTDSRIKFYDDNGVWRGGFGFTNYANNTTYPNFHDSFYMMTDPSSNGTLAVAMRINREGAFMFPKQPCFSVAMSNDYNSGTTHVANFDTVRFDQGNNFNTGSNGIFTAPVSGKYYMHAAIQTMQGGTASQVHIMGVSFLVNGSVQSSKGSGDQYLGRDADHYITVHCIRILNLAQGDTVQVYIQLHATVRIEGSGGTDRCNWQGYLMA